MCGKRYRNYSAKLMAGEPVPESLRYFINRPNGTKRRRFPPYPTPYPLSPVSLRHTTEGETPWRMRSAMIDETSEQICPAPTSVAMDREHPIVNNCHHRTQAHTGAHRARQPFPRTRSRSVAPCLSVSRARTRSSPPSRRRPMLSSGPHAPLPLPLRFCLQSGRSRRRCGSYGGPANGRPAGNHTRRSGRAPDVEGERNAKPWRESRGRGLLVNIRRACPGPRRRGLASHMPLAPCTYGANAQRETD
jgi:hypothetical protein